MITEITAYDSKGGVSYHYSTPRYLTDEEIKQELREMCVDIARQKIEIKKIWNANK